MNICKSCNIRMCTICVYSVLINIRVRVSDRKAASFELMLEFAILHKLYFSELDDQGQPMNCVTAKMRLLTIVTVGYAVALLRFKTTLIQI